MYYLEIECKFKYFSRQAVKIQGLFKTAQTLPVNLYNWKLVAAS